MEIKETMTTNRNKQEEDTNKILKRETILKEFLLSYKSDILNCEGINKLEDFFNSINSIVFAGFDYYYIDDFKELFTKDVEEADSKIDMLINEEHLDKLKTTIDSFDSLEFVDYEDKSYIWYKNTNIVCYLIPFERQNNELVIKEVGRDKRYIEDESYNQEYNNLEYKLIK